jgi:hypothetical protein
VSIEDRVRKLEAKVAPAAPGRRADFSSLNDEELDRLSQLLQAHVDGKHLVEREREELAALESRAWGAKVSAESYRRATA